MTQAPVPYIVSLCTLARAYHDSQGLGVLYANGSDAKFIVFDELSPNMKQTIREEIHVDMREGTRCAYVAIEQDGKIHIVRAFMPEPTPPMRGTGVSFVMYTEQDCLSETTLRCLRAMRFLSEVDAELVTNAEVTEVPMPVVRVEDACGWGETASAATKEFVIHLFDGDWYADTYLAESLKKLKEHDVAGCSSVFVYDRETEKTHYMDAEDLGPSGFSETALAYRARVLRTPGIDPGEPSTMSTLVCAMMSPLDCVCCVSTGCEYMPEAPHVIPHHDRVTICH